MSDPVPYRLHLPSKGLILCLAVGSKSDKELLNVVASIIINNWAKVMWECASKSDLYHDYTL